MTRYPNLLELHKYHPYGEPAMCDHAGIEPELLHAVLYDNELLEPAEVRGLSLLYGCPVGVLMHHDAVMLDMGRMRHRAMAEEVRDLYIQLQRMAQDGNREAEKYLGYVKWKFTRFLEAVRDNRLSYCHYFGMMEDISQCIGFAAPRPGRRQLRRRNEKGGGAIG